MSIQLFSAEVSEQVAAKLLEIEAIRLSTASPFTWSSGWLSPIYCDNRLSLSYPAVRRYVTQQLTAAIEAHFTGAEVIAGVATAGIPQGALVAEALGLPFVYVRSKPKGHGMENLIEGKVMPGARVVVIEDLVSTGGSSLKAATALQHASFEVMGMAAIFTYGFDTAQQNFQEANIPLVVLSHYEALIQLAVANGHVTAQQAQSLQAWRSSPATWGR